jgi:hypothetical protein
MAQQYIELGQTGQQSLDIINSNFTELYTSQSTALIKNNQSANFSENIAANTFISNIMLGFLSGTPSIKIGTTPNGNEILDTITLDDANNWSFIVSEIKPQATSYTLYFTISGGVINSRINQISNIF